MTTPRRLLLILLLLFAAWAPASFGETKRHDVPLEGSPSVGPANAPVTIVEFIDFQ